MNPEIKKRIELVRRGEAPEGYMRTRAGIMPNDWLPIRTAKEIFKSHTNKKHGGAYEVLSATQEHGIIPRSEVDIDIKYAEDSVGGYKKVDCGDFVISLRSFQGGIEFSEFDGLVSPAYTVLKPILKISNLYYKAYFKTADFIQRLNSAVYGIRDGKQIGYEDFGELILYNPPLREQQKIAEILTCSDKVICLKKQLIEEKRRQKTSLIQKLLDPNSGVRLPGYKGEWKKRRLGDLGRIRKGGGISVDCTVQEGLPAMMYGDIYIKYNISFSEVDYRITADCAKKSTPVKSGDLLFTATGETAIEIGKCVCYQGVPTIYIGGDIFSLTPKSDNSMFLSYQLNSFPAIKQKARYGQGFSVVHIGVDALKKVQVLLPPTIEEQTAIASILSAADREIDLLEQELEAWQQKRKALMQLLLTGLVRV